MMLPFKEIRIIPCHDGGGFNVFVDDRWANGTGPDETLGVVASVLFGACQKPLYVKTREENEAWEKRYGLKPEKPDGEA